MTSKSADEPSRPSSYFFLHPLATTKISNRRVGVAVVDFIVNGQTKDRELPINVVELLCRWSVGGVHAIRWKASREDVAQLGDARALPGGAGLRVSQRAPPLLLKIQPRKLPEDTTRVKQRLPQPRTLKLRPMRLPPAQCPSVAEHKLVRWLCAAAVDARVVRLGPESQPNGPTGASVPSAGTGPSERRTRWRRRRAWV